MRTLVFVLCSAVALPLAACQRPCGGCAKWETCDRPSNTCEINDGTTFDVVAVSGTINGNVTLTEGVPSPQLCLALGAGEVCSKVVQASYAPGWHETLFNAVDGYTLLGVPLSYRYVNTGLFSSGTLCAGTVQLKPWIGKGFRQTCPDGSDFNVDIVSVGLGTAPPDGGHAADDAGAVDAAADD